MEILFFCFQLKWKERKGRNWWKNSDEIDFKIFNFFFFNLIGNNAEGSGMSVYNDHMVTANALRMGSPTGVNNPAYRAGSSGVSGSNLGLLRNQRSLDAAVDPSGGMTSASSTSNLTHFGSSAIRFRSGGQQGNDSSTFKDERLVLISIPLILLGCL